MKIDDEELKCTFLPIVQSDQLPNDEEGINFWPFLPLKAQLKHFFFPMLHQFDFVGNIPITLEDTISMKIMVDWIKDKSGQPAAIQFFINKRKTIREDSILIYFNSGALTELMQETQFQDLPDEEYHELGNLWWKMWANIPMEAPRSSKNNFIKLMEPITIKNSVRRVNYRFTKAEDEFLSECLTSNEWANASVLTDNSLPEVTAGEDNRAIMEWQQNMEEKKAEQFRPVQLPLLQWKTEDKSKDQRLKIIMKTIKELDFRTEARISINSKVKKYEEGLKDAAIQIIQQLDDLQKEKEFYNLEAKSNEKLLNEYYLPQLHFILEKQYKYGQKLVEVKEQETQYEELPEMIDWSGQWSSDNDNE